MILNAFVLAFRSISRNYLRAFLTMLGIIIGTGSVVVMISLGNGMSKKVKDSISSLGNNLLTIYPSRGLDTSGKSLRKNFNLQEVETIKSRIYGIDSIAPVADGSALIRYKNHSRESEIIGVDREYFSVGNWEIAEGRGFVEEEYKSGANVCIIGNSVKTSLFSEDSALGSKIKVGNKDGSIICQCIGVLKEKGQSIGFDQDEIVLFPLKSYVRTIGRDKQSVNNINKIMISLNENVSSTSKAKEIREVLRDIRNITGKSDSFEIMDAKQFEEELTSTIRMLTLFVGSIAGVSLIVGGIGIMNIMLVSITERTKEIGTRLAIGALQKEVLLQFLIESIVISSIGGLIGIFLSFFISLGLSFLMNIPFVYSIFVAVCAFIFSSIIGILFGYIPSKRASKLNPIDALRHE